MAHIASRVPGKHFGKGGKLFLRHLQKAMALLTRNQAAFIEQFARNDQERLALQRKRDERELENNEWQRGDKRFDRIEVDLLKLPKMIVSNHSRSTARIKNRVQISGVMGQRGP